MIQADLAQVNQVLINLVKNAMEALELVPIPRLKITLKRILDSMSIEVRDNGPGIPDETLI